jgi:hypothetical protein
MTTKIPQVVTPLYGHTSEDTAYLIKDYPYGFTLRCQKKVWLEFRPGKGYRLVSRTSNPKKGGIWNKPDKSTYTTIANLFLDQDGHVQWKQIWGGEKKEVLEQFAKDFPQNPDVAAIQRLAEIVAKREAAQATAPIG